MSKIAKIVKNIGKAVMDNPTGKTINNIFKDVEKDLSMDFKLESSSKVITKKCIGCGAIITGKEGSIVYCEYCDRKQEL